MRLERVYVEPVAAADDTVPLDNRNHFAAILGAQKLGGVVTDISEALDNH